MTILETIASSKKELVVKWHHQSFFQNNFESFLSIPFILIGLKTNKIPKWKVSVIRTDAITSILKSIR